MDNRYSAQILSLLRLLEDVVELEWDPRMTVLPLVTWRPRRFNIIADHMANQSMDMEQDIFIRDQYIHRVQNGQLLQFHSDGGCRSDMGKAAAAFTMSIVSVAGKTAQLRLAVAASTYMGPSDSTIDEINALCKAMQYFIEHQSDI